MYRYVVEGFTCVSISNIVGGKVRSTKMTAYTDVCNIYYFISIYTRWFKYDRD